MSEHWLSLTKIPAEGRDFSFTEQSFWTEPIREFSLPFRIVEPLEATLHVTPHKNGCYVRGRLVGTVEIPCDRCTRPTLVPLDHAFEVHESLDDQDGELDSTLLRMNGETMELDVAGLLWEQLVLSLPPKPLCREECQGLCPVCGQDLNVAACTCLAEQGDPRLDVLKNLTIGKK